MRKCWQVCIIPALLLTTAVPAGLALAQEESKELSIELIDPKVLRVCADPRNMPFSDQQGEGFENKLAELFAQKLGKSLSYVWYPQATGFVRNTLGAHKCDVIMGFPQGNDIVQSTNPYYRTSYALVFKSGNALDGVETLSDPRLKGNRRRGDAERPAAQGKAHRHRGRHAAEQLPGGRGPDGERQALSAGHRHARRFLGPGDDRGPGRRRDRCRRAVGADGGLLRQAGKSAAHRGAAHA